MSLKDGKCCECKEEPKDHVLHQCCDCGRWLCKDCMETTNKKWNFCLYCRQLLDDIEQDMMEDIEF